MIKKVIKSYETLNAELLAEMPINDSKTRKFIQDRLKLDLPDCNIKCDEENNSPMLIDQCVAIVKVWWINNKNEITYVDLVFGSPQQIAKVQPQLPL